MSQSRNNLQQTLNHEQPDRMVVDFGATPVTGIHVLVVEQLRKHFGLEQKPVKVTEPDSTLRQSGGGINNACTRALTSSK